MPTLYPQLCFMIEYQVQINSSNQTYLADLNKGIEVGLVLKDGAENPNCYYADPPEFEVIIAGDFKGSVGIGGPVNHRKVHFSPHGNGTHTECYGHISADPEATMDKFFSSIHALCRLVSVEPEQTGKDLVIRKIPGLSYFDPIDAIAVRTLPNQEEKKTKNYSGTNPPYIDAELTDQLGNLGILHLLTDLPSIDPEIDGGKLAAHKSFFGWPSPKKPFRSITELCYFPPELPDGLYFLQIQIMSINLDVSPSRPILFPLSNSHKS